MGSVISYGWVLTLVWAPVLVSKGTPSLGSSLGVGRQARIKAGGGMLRRDKFSDGRLEHCIYCQFYFETLATPPETPFWQAHARLTTFLRFSQIGSRMLHNPVLLFRQDMDRGSSRQLIQRSRPYHLISSGQTESGVVQGFSFDAGVAGQEFLLPAATQH